MAKFLMQELVLQGDVVTSRLGAGSGAANYIDDKEVGKIVKLVGESRFGLAVAGDPIEGFVKAVESATLDDFSIGSVAVAGRKEVVFDGLEATPGTGVVAIGDFVVVGTVVAKGTALTASCKVTKATVQPGSVAGSLTEAGRQARLAASAWRIVSLGSAGTGAVGTVGVIERLR